MEITYRQHLLFVTCLIVAFSCSSMDIVGGARHILQEAEPPALGLPPTLPPFEGPPAFDLPPVSPFQGPPAFDLPPVFPFQGPPAFGLPPVSPFQGPPAFGMPPIPPLQGSPFNRPFPGPGNGIPFFPQFPGAVPGASPAGFPFFPNPPVFPNPNP